MKKAFTLAEVLITLVIIGVVAALTLPTLMTKYQQHVFGNQFKKSLSTISNIIVKVRSDLGVSKLAEYCTEYYRNNGGYINLTTCVNEINNQIIKVSKSSNPNNIVRTSENIKTYNVKNNLTLFDPAVRAVFYTNQLADGSFLGFWVHNSQLYFAADLNGYKKPNRLGYDSFIFSIKKQNDVITGFQDRTPSNVSDDDAVESCKNDSFQNACEISYGVPCSLESTRAGNGLGCAYYALRNKCPYDDTKTYWECLK